MTRCQRHRGGGVAGQRRLDRIHLCAASRSDLRPLSARRPVREGNSENLKLTREYLERAGERRRPRRRRRRGREDDRRGHAAYIMPEQDRLGYSIGYAGDMDGDGVEDIVVGADGADDGYAADPSARAGAGAVFVLFLNRDGTVKQKQKNLKHKNLKQKNLKHRARVSVGRRRLQSSRERRRLRAEQRGHRRRRRGRRARHRRGSAGP